MKLTEQTLTLTGPPPQRADPRCPNRSINTGVSRRVKEGPTTQSQGACCDTEVRGIQTTPSILADTREATSPLQKQMN